jgi:4-hydroxy-tetrahydrodipicolinate reductase
MIRVVVVGVGGRMAGRVAQLVAEASDMALVGGVESKGTPFIGKDLGEVLRGAPTGHFVTDDLAKVVAGADVVVAFTAPPDPTVTAAKIAGAAGKAMVTGTTGLSPSQMKDIAGSLGKCPYVYASNFSVGVTVLTKLVEDAALLLGGDYDVEVVEAHHRFKKDAPSGTALTLAEAAARGLSRDLARVGVYGRHGDTGARTREEIGVHALRAGDLVGEHTVMFGGMGETVQISHRAQSRDSLASGAVRAIRFAAGAKPGRYSMREVLGIP